ncbi:GGDEF domain-containing protein [Aeromonas caviae]|uniref:Thiamine pyrimidine synthase n=1 Tax=Aeromonas caviae TaxID=648 RepID=A0AA37CT78_AERCA|nr:GGDEF domain-containing protein [Aeromonas caviae]GJA17531.1 diguanylate cyclase [Aeromonas caviae]GJA28229.1 diguanylate cyclase [Aeromonas caviae]GJA61585.1 diguanylate cyclase [Aeromonas caviae]GJA71219.1 diguanylate cyclase [Aeromonas caviae]
MKKCLFWLLLLGITCFSPLQASERTRDLPEKVVLQLRWLHQPQFVGYHMAKAKGYYADVGLDVEIRPGGKGISPVQEVLAGRADFGVGNTEVLTHYAQGKPLLALASVYQHSPSIFLARRDSGILTVADMRGKRIMMFPGHQDAELLATLYYQGLHERQLIPVPTSVNIDDLIAGRIDIFNAYLSNEPFYLEERGISVSVINPRNYGIDFYSDILFTTQAQERLNPERVARFRAASLKGWRYALTHPEEAIALLRTEYGVNRSQAHMEYELQMSKEMIQPLYVEIGYMNPDRFAHIMQQLVEIGLLAKPVSLTRFLYQVPSEQWSFWRPWFLLSLGVGGLILLLSLYLLMSNKRLNQEVALRKQREQEILQLARLDPLTGLPNRLSLMEQLKHQVQSDNPGCLLFCDLNDFKRINDNFGHSQGDAILCQLARRIHDAIGHQCYFARLAGDEFILLLPGYDIRQAEEVTAVIRQAMQAPFVVNDQPMQVGISIGVSHYQHDWSPEQWLIQADRAMYCDKGGRVITLAEQSG